eukprot:TRINITY_DN5672_c0_g2_i1.p1 TRINITY_DN5672_c0_g2~~TRINITY_DN5672_c0_g2_i1.p1  ORF type:complete len:110 (+),score=24.82 TRINITY_DN5672_c0_g2_i1:105-434(+)
MASSVSNTAIKFRKHSGLQKEVIKLYRDLMGAVRHKYQKEEGIQSSSKDNLITFIRDNFKQKAHSIPFKDISRIEYFLNQGRRQLKQLRNSQFETFSMHSTNSSNVPKS